MYACLDISIAPSLTGSAIVGKPVFDCISGDCTVYTWRGRGGRCRADECCTFENLAQSRLQFVSISCFAKDKLTWATFNSRNSFFELRGSFLGWLASNISIVSCFKSDQQIFAEATIMLVGRQLGLKGGSLGLRCLSVAAGEASEALGHVEAEEGRLDRNRVS